MAENYKLYIILIILFPLMLFANDDLKKIGIYYENYDFGMSEAELTTFYMINRAEEHFAGSEQQLIHFSLSDSEISVKALINYAAEHNMDGICRIIFQKKNNNQTGDVPQISFQLKMIFLDNAGTQLFQEAIDFTEGYNIKYIEEKQILNQFFDIFQKAFHSVKPRSVKISPDTIKKKRKLKDWHDYPIFNFGVDAVSVKMYYDSREDEFAIFPIDIRLAFFPFRYWEVGLFCRFENNNTIFKYMDYNQDKEEYFESGFNFYYGIFTGLSFFSENTHYSIGVAIYNMFYQLTEDTFMQKKENYQSWFIPQFAIYQRMTFRLFKIFHYTLYFNIRVLPYFYKEDQYFYSRPFHYNFIILEASILGFSITI
ncbi:MAG: hypothetical protein MJB14_19380 [Spirochaetes bacterium]|nr:hypothetical protein [Spirochaetota bacterium]